jgi:hypothetical protein
MIERVVLIVLAALIVPALLGGYFKILWLSFQLGWNFF